MIKQPLKTICLGLLVLVFTIISAAIGLSGYLVSLLIIGMIWVITVDYFDWNYITSKERWLIFSGPINTVSESTKNFNTGVVIASQQIFLNLDETPKTLHYLGRWTKFHDSRTEISIWKDNLTGRWYITK